MSTHPRRTSSAWALAVVVAVAGALAVYTVAFAQGSTAPAHDMASMPGVNPTAAPDKASPPGSGMADMPGMEGADSAMSHEHMGMGPHMKMTSARPRATGDDVKAQAIVDTAKTAIAKYRDYHVAIADHFIEFAPNIKQPMYHFTNYRYAAEAQSHFDPSRPTSLLYKPTPDGFELVGAMYTAPRAFDEAQLDERVPLSIASWHQHVNICLPPKSAYATSDWMKFGFHGSIATESECQSNGGIFHSVIFGWMVHVYPFEKDEAKIWAH
jgi:hypothetical protein